MEVCGDKVCADALEVLKKKFGISSLKDYQTDFFKTFHHHLQQQQRVPDFFIAQPTGHGKSLLFQGISCFLGHLALGQVQPSSTTALVICPINALIEDQVALMAKRDIIAKRWTHDMCAKDLECVDVLFTSPETILSDSSRDLLKKKDVIKTICAVFVDESHCIEKWGTSSDKRRAAFRESFSQLAEVRSLLAKPIPFVAMTATAMRRTRDFIIANLQMYQPKLYIRSPGKQNITYILHTVNHKNVDKIFQPLIEELRIHKYDCERVVIFSNRDNVVDIFGSFDYILREEYPMYETRPYAMYHSTTEEPIKKHIVESFQDPNGTIRILMATIAFGMGIDCKNLHQVIHFGPPADLDSYFQESGRAGRDGKQSVALLLRYPKSFIRNSSETIKEYCLLEDKCRRQMLLKLYDSSEKIPEITPQHNCCDFCYQSCDCGDCHLPKHFIDVDEIKPIIDVDEEVVVEEDTECFEREDSGNEIDSDE